MRCAGSAIEDGTARAKKNAIAGSADNRAGIDDSGGIARDFNRVQGATDIAAGAVGNEAASREVDADAGRALADDRAGIGQGAAGRQDDSGAGGAGDRSEIRDRPRSVEDANPGERAADQRRCDRRCAIRDRGLPSVKADTVVGRGPYRAVISDCGTWICGGRARITIV